MVQGRFLLSIKKEEIKRREKEGEESRGGRKGRREEAR